MNIINKTISGILISVLLTITGVIILLKMSSEKREQQQPDLDLLLAEFLFFDYKSVSIKYNFFWDSVPSSIWEMADPIEKLPIKWIINKSDFESINKVTYGIKNITGTKIYYMSWGRPISRIQTDFFIHKNGKIDTLLFRGFGCSTGTYLFPLANNELAVGSELNPLLKNPYSNHKLEIESSSFPDTLKLLYGDSVGIRFSLATYCLPWTKYKSQKIYSEVFTVKTEKLIANWNETYQN